jgi:hypothetical protein
VCQGLRGSSLVHVAYTRGRKRWPTQCWCCCPGGGSKNKKKKKAGGNGQPLADAPTAVAAAVVGGGQGPRGDKHSR